MARKQGWLAACLYGVALFAYWPSLNGSLLWNDSDYVTAPALRSWNGLGRIWFEVGAVQQYYPVLHTAFWIEHHLWGDATVGYHLVNVLLHASAALLFGLVLRRLNSPVFGSGHDDASRAEGRGKPPWEWVAAFVFALHPVCVESVAWISEEKNTLSTVFYLAAALAYLRFYELSRQSAGAPDPGGARPSGNRRPAAASAYGLATGLFVLAL